jgi:hypothetical protein
VFLNNTDELIKNIHFYEPFTRKITVLVPFLRRTYRRPTGSDLNESTWRAEISIARTDRSSICGSQAPSIFFWAGGSITIVNYEIFVKYSFH